MEAIAILQMEELEARQCVERVKAGLEDVRGLLLDLKERDGWKALGYPSWRECAQAEFGRSQRRVYELVDAAMVDRVLRNSAKPLPESHANELAPLAKSDPDQAREVWAEVQRHSEEAGEPITAGMVREHVTPRMPNRTQFTGDIEWYTPSEHLERVRAVLGAIDLDPASSEAAQEIVQAAKFYTLADDGLKQPWAGRVWLNPPYAQPAIYDFCAKLADEYRSGNIKSAILLTHNYTDTAWFHLAEAAANLLCFTRGRIRFVDNRGNIAAPTQGQCFFYFGDDPNCFRQMFREVGFIR